MEISDILQSAATTIESNSDDATTGLDVGDISSALGDLLGDGEGGIDLGSLVSNFSSNGLSSIVSSWLDSGENQLISSEQLTNLISSDKISEFASNLGLSEESAKGAIAQVLPQIVDKATVGEDNLLTSMLDQVGGTKGVFDMMSKMFK